MRTNEWLPYAITASAILLMLLGSLVLDNAILTIGGALLMVLGTVMMLRAQGIGGWAPVVGVVIAAAVIIFLRSIR